MFIAIDFESETPIYEQLRRQIITGIASKQLKKGESLPSVRQMAEDIGINLHTVNKAYNILKNEGYVIIDRRLGAVINEKLPTTSEEFEMHLKEELKFLISESCCREMKKEHFISLCSELYDKFN